MRFSTAALLLICIFCLPASVLGDTHVLNIVDIVGKGLADVEVRATSCSAGLGCSTQVQKTDASGIVSVTHCPSFGGGCCQLSPVTTYTITKPGFTFHSYPSGGSVGCSATPGGTTYRLDVVGIDLPPLPAVSAASYTSDLAVGMLAAVFGADLALTTEIAGSTTQTELAGRSVMFRDLHGNEFPAALLFVSPGQINLITPEGLRGTLVILTLKDAAGNILKGSVAEIRTVAPGIFTANQDGKGVPSAVLARARTNGELIYEPVAAFDESQQRFLPVPISFESADEQVYLVLFGTGWRGASQSAVRVLIDNVDCPVTYSGVQPTYAGLDQMNILLPRTLIGRGTVSVETRVNSLANRVELNFR